MNGWTTSFCCFDFLPTSYKEIIRVLQIKHCNLSALSLIYGKYFQKYIRRYSEIYFHVAGISICENAVLVILNRLIVYEGELIFVQSSSSH